MLSIANLFKAILLCLNAMAILSERRFLAPLGLATPNVTAEQQSAHNPNRTSSNFYNEDPFGNGGGNGNANSGNSVGRFSHQSPVKAQVAQLLGSVRMLLRWPLIICNIVMIFFALIFG